MSEVQSYSDDVDSDQTVTELNDSQPSPEGSWNDRSIHSLLLCPAQWTALLESPVSLVRQGMDKEEGLEEITEDDEEDTLTNECDNVPDSDLSCPSVVQIDDNVTTGSESEEKLGLNKSLISTTDDDVPSHIATRRDKIYCTPAHLLPVSSTVMSTVSQCTTVGNCTTSRSDGTIRGNKSPNMSESSSRVLESLPISNSVSERSSASTPISEHSNTSFPEHLSTSNAVSEPLSTPVSENRLPIHFTHSRNVSETPSLPPFISSSSSSAYHSRNSSMASQFTFDSDSQFTDIDSCIITYTGGNDIHRPISLQEARFKFPDVTPIEVSMQKQWFSDINMTAPIRVPEHFFVSPHLEGTLTTTEQGINVAGPNENLEDKLISAALKSSEWIKREMRYARQTLVQVKVSSRSRHVVHFNVKAGDMFVWEFATKRKDISFGLSFEPTEVATQQEVSL
jgi:hypothetical protein